MVRVQRSCVERIGGQWSTREPQAPRAAETLDTGGKGTDEGVSTDRVVARDGVDP